MYIYTINICDDSGRKKIQDVCGPANGSIKECKEYAEDVLKKIKSEHSSPEKITMTRRILPGI